MTSKMKKPNVPNIGKTLADQIIANRKLARRASRAARRRLPPIAPR